MENPLLPKFFKKKSLGQHFLTSREIARQLALSIDIQKGDTVLEIGPGEGVLTREIIALGATLIAIEKDPELIIRLKETFAEEIAAKSLTLIEGDIRTTPLPEGKYKVAANIPYYITSEILRRVLTAPTQPEAIALLMQKEVAERIVRSEKESILSLSVKAYGTPSYIRTVKAGSFSPAPKVDSAILAIRDISRKHFIDISEEDFFHILHATFGEKRKQLGKTLSQIAPRDTVQKALMTADVPFSTRPEDISLSTWITVTKLLAPHINK